MYAVAKGREVGIFGNWTEAEKQVKNYSGAIYKKFNNITEAEEFIAKYRDVNYTSQTKNENQEINLQSAMFVKDGHPSTAIGDYHFEVSSDNNPIKIGKYNLNPSILRSSGLETEMKYIASQLKDNEAIAYVDGSFRNDKMGLGVVLITSNNYFLLSDRVLDEELKSMRNVTGEVLGSLLAMFVAYSNQKSELKIYHDYEGVSKWANFEWKTNKEFTKDYKILVEEFRKYINIDFFKVQSHTGVLFNEVADQLASYSL